MIGLADAGRLSLEFNTNEKRGRRCPRPFFLLPAIPFLALHALDSLLISMHPSLNSVRNYIIVKCGVLFRDDDDVEMQCRETRREQSVFDILNL